MNKFINLHKYFENATANNITLNFGEIEKIIGETLTASAFKYKQYWHDSKTHMIPKAWVYNNYKIISLDLNNQIVKYEKIIN